MKMINWAELTDLASPEMLIFASFQNFLPQKVKTGDIYCTIFRIFPFLSLGIGFKIEGWYPDKIIILSWLPTSYLDWNLTVVGPSFLPALPDIIEYSYCKNLEWPRNESNSCFEQAIKIWILSYITDQNSWNNIFQKKFKYFLKQKLLGGGGHKCLFGIAMSKV